jgi:hypothetical protein
MGKQFEIKIKQKTMLEQYFSQPTPKVYWWRSRAFRVGLAVFVALAVLAVVLFNQQIGDLLKSFGIKAATEITLDGNAQSASYFLNGSTSTPYSDSFMVNQTTHRLMLNPDANITQ